MDEWPIEKQRILAKIIKYQHIRDELHIIEGLILNNKYMVIPPNLQNKILQKLHMSHLSVEEEENEEEKL